MVALRDLGLADWIVPHTHRRQQMAPGYGPGPKDLAWFAPGRAAAAAGRAGGLAALAGARDHSTGARVLTGGFPPCFRSSSDV